MKVIGLNALSVSCEEIATGTSFELSAEYSGEPLNHRNTLMLTSKML